MYNIMSSNDILSVKKIIYIKIRKRTCVSGETIYISNTGIDIVDTDIGRCCLETYVGLHKNECVKLLTDRWLTPCFFYQVTDC